MRICREKEVAGAVDLIDDKADGRAGIGGGGSGSGLKYQAAVLIGESVCTCKGNVLRRYTDCLNT